MQAYQDQIQEQALRDLTNRAKSGTFIYLIAWLVLALPFEVNIDHPAFFQTNTIILIFLAAVRMAHYVVMQRPNRFSIKALNAWITIALLACALHWGLLLLWAVYTPELTEIENIFLICCAAFALGGSCTLSISNTIRLLYPVLMLVPTTIYFFWEGSTESLVYGPLFLVSIGYIAASSKASHNDYWDALTHSLVAEDRAEQLRQISITDPLTQISNRMHFDHEYKREWRRAQRSSVPVSVLMIDLDHFKKVNDTYGHIFGDKCLVAVANTLSDCVLRPTDCVARYGGEEFIALLSTTGPEGAITIANRILSSIRALKIDYEGTPVPITVSIGIASTVPQTKSKMNRKELIRQADTSLYAAKDAGRDTYKLAPQENIE